MKAPFMRQRFSSNSKPITRALGFATSIPFKHDVLDLTVRGEQKRGSDPFRTATEKAARKATGLRVPHCKCPRCRKSIPAPGNAPQKRTWPNACHSVQPQVTPIINGHRKVAWARPVRQGLGALHHPWTVALAAGGWSRQKDCPSDLPTWLAARASAPRARCA